MKVTHHAEVLSVTDVPFRSWISAFLFMVHSQDKVQERKNNIHTYRVSTQDSYVRQQMPIAVFNKWLLDRGSWLYTLAVVASAFHILKDVQDELFQDHLHPVPKKSITREELSSL